ncbi:hypothetical protein [Nocardiopsis quinghaiensis]|uniref:hypothetical protein n=1 Tax=Nocardiopsis quinghaiensis TaxID=464995 RepID=UPI00123854EE|nr:hypothetical protein [Nocardiopsis quinghaiensis]
MRAPTYPVVDERALSAPSRQGFLGLRGRRRDPSELPRASAHQVLVYRGGGAFHVDKGGTALDDSRVVDADHVSLVDVSHDVSVVVTLAVPSMEDDDFEVRTAFSCTVLDPVTVVSEGRGDAHRFLSGYMRRYDKLPQVAQHLRLEDINKVRELVWSHIKAFIDLSPPEVRGMRIEYVGTEVLTPHSLRQVRSTWRTTRHEQEVEVARTDHDHLMKEKVTEHTRRIMDGLSEAVQDDTINAVMLALAEGRIDPTEVAHRITVERERALDREAERETAEKEERLRREEQQRADALRRETWDREDERERLRVRSELAQAAFKEHYVDGAMTTAEVVDFINPELLPLRTGATDGEEGSAGSGRAADAELETGSGPEASADGQAVRPRGGPGARTRADASAGPVSKGHRRYAEGLSEDDHDA